MLPPKQQVPGVRSALEVLHRQAIGVPTTRLVQQGQGIVRRDEHQRTATAERVQRSEDRAVPDGMRDGAGVEHWSGVRPCVGATAAGARLSDGKGREVLAHIYLVMGRLVSRLAPLLQYALC